MLKNFRFQKPIQIKDEDLIIDIDEEIDLDPQYIISEDMNEIEANEIEAEEIKYDQEDWDFKRDPDYNKINEDYE